LCSHQATVYQQLAHVFEQIYMHAASARYKTIFFLFLKKNRKYLSPASAWHPPLIALTRFPSCSLVLPSSWKIDPFTRDPFLSSNPALLRSPTSSRRVPCNTFTHPSQWHCPFLRFSLFQGALSPLVRHRP